MLADTATRQVLGIERVLELVSPDSESARKRWFAPSCLTPDQHDARQLFTARRRAQLRFESWWLGLGEDVRHEERVRHALVQMPLDLKRILNKIRVAETLAESELFALKRFLYHTTKLMRLAASGFAIDRLDPEEDLRTLADLLQHIHPETEPSPRFHLSDALDEELADSRRALVSARRTFMARRKALVERVAPNYPGVRFDLDGEASMSGEQSLRAATDPDIEPRGSLWRLRDEELDAARGLVASLEHQVELHELLVRQHLSQELRRHIDWLKAMLDAVTLFDLRLARMRLRARMHGSWPLLTSDASEDTMRVLLEEGVTPLIDGDAATLVQPIDFDFTQRPVIITGPNMGGKSSLLRLVGLCQWCMQHGLPVPAKRYDAPLVRHIVYTGSDLPRPEQEHRGGLEGLSSFGREIRRLVVARQQTRPVTLWLLDEVGRGTHPEDGTLLAMEILDTLQARGDLVICATHFPGLAKKPGVARWRIAGLVERERLEAMIQSLSSTTSLDALERLERALRASMDYRPVRLDDGEESVPRDAHLIARLLGW